MAAEFDLAIIGGGGVNGCGIAREAARRGLQKTQVVREQSARHPA